MALVVGGDTVSRKRVTFLFVNKWCRPVASVCGRSPAGSSGELSVEPLSICERSDVAAGSGPRVLVGHAHVRFSGMHAFVQWGSTAPLRLPRQVLGVLVGHCALRCFPPEGFLRLHQTPERRLH